jgi:hypothetical protein
MLMYKVLIRPVLTYASLIWTVSETNWRRLGLFERKVFRCIFGAKQEIEIWRPTRPQTQHDCHHDTKVKPEAATAVIELLMMDGKKPETC